MGKLSDILGLGNDFGNRWNSTKAASEFAPLPAGEYTARILSGKPFNSRRKATPGYKLTCEVTEGEYEGRRLWFDFWLTDAALPMTKRDLAKIGIEREEQLDQPLPLGILLKAKVSLRRDEEGNEVNKIVRFECIGVEPGDAFEPKDGDQSFEPTPLDKPKDNGQTSNGLTVRATGSGPYGNGGDRR